MRNIKTVIMAGGRGTRLASCSRNGLNPIPKPLMPVAGVPILEREIDVLREQGFTDFVLTVSYLGEQIREYFGDGSAKSPVTGKPFGVHISYYEEQQPLGNAGALFKLRNQLTEDFLLLNADLLFDVDLSRLVAFHRAHGGLATIMTHANDHPYDSGLIICGKDRTVERWLAKEDARPEYYSNCVNSGIHILSPEILTSSGIASTSAGQIDENSGKSCKIDLDRQILKPLAGTGKLFCYDSPEYVRDMGTPERLVQAEKDVESGIVAAKSLRQKQKAIFLDRDGTINRYVGYLTQPEAFELLPGVAEAIRTINLSGYLCIVITNQPAVARGELTMQGLREIHRKMETLLGKQGAYIDGIYVCPHHPDKGFPGEVPELKVNCDCRKPKPGMLYQAAKDLHIDLASSWMIGDSWRDMACGKNGGTHTCLLLNALSEQNETSKKINSDMISPTLLEAIRNILDEEASS